MVLAVWPLPAFRPGFPVRNRLVAPEKGLYVRSLLRNQMNRRLWWQPYGGTSRVISRIMGWAGFIDVAIADIVTADRYGLPRLIPHLLDIKGHVLHHMPKAYSALKGLVKFPSDSPIMTKGSGISLESLEILLANLTYRPRKYLFTFTANQTVGYRKGSMKCCYPIDLAQRHTRVYRLTL
jgi:hypothetical protein